jgi:hypothetical protein
MPPKTREQLVEKTARLKKKVLEKGASMDGRRLRLVKKKIRRAQRRRRVLVSTAARRAGGKKDDKKEG